jgi:hypothetical protein
MNKKRQYKELRASYPFSGFVVDERAVIAFASRDLAVNARCAAHVMANTKGWKFKTKIRETDAGLFELSVCRAK